MLHYEGKEHSSPPATACTSGPASRITSSTTPRTWNTWRSSPPPTLKQLALRGLAQILAYALEKGLNA